MPLGLFTKKKASIIVEKVENGFIVREKTLGGLSSVKNVASTRKEVLDQIDRILTSISGYK